MQYRRTMIPIVAAFFMTIVLTSAFVDGIGKEIVFLRYKGIGISKIVVYPALSMRSEEEVAVRVLIGVPTDAYEFPRQLAGENSVERRR